jgi:hypothetical protein
LNGGKQVRVSFAAKIGRSWGGALPVTRRLKTHKVRRVIEEDSMALDRVGFVGVGLMGHGMAKNIVEKGHPLTIMAHRNREPVDDLKSRGA